MTMVAHSRRLNYRPLVYWYTGPRTKVYFFEALQEYCDLIDNAKLKSQACSFGRVGWFLKRYQFLKKQKPDAIVADGFGLTTLVMALQAKRLRIPFIMRVRGGMVGEFRDEVRIRPGWRRNLYAKYQERLRDWILYLSDIILTVSAFGKGQLLYELPKLDPQKMCVVYKPVDFQRLSHVLQGKFRQHLGLSLDSHIILAVTNFNYYRKYEALLYYYDTVLRLLSEHPGWCYIILGKGHDLEKFKVTLYNQTPTRLRDRVILAGYYPNIEEAMADADIVLYLSFRDMAPQVVKEAQAMGKPIVVNQSGGGMIEFIPSYLGKPPMIIEEPDELFDRLKALIGEEKLRTQIGEANRRWAKEQYAVHLHARRFAEAIMTVIRRGV